MSNELNQDLAMTASAAIGSKTLNVGAWTAGLGFIFSSEFLGLAGLLLAIAGFLVSSHYTRKRHALLMAEDRRQQLEHEVRMKTLLLTNEQAKED